MKKLFLLLAAIVTIMLGASAQTRTITGTVLSASDKEPLVGATVIPVGGGSGTSTDLDGHFTLHISAAVKELRVSYVGYNTLSVKPEPNMTILLQESDNRLDEVVVTGYGSGKKLGSVVGSV
ncbi:MAG: carboxypeptidase-like regulatory domain-containing protein [Bacteroidales bacterium]|nr:carboxypeptidase-like regulatory domain-containing protein [Bacteroidales bacterium]